MEGVQNQDKLSIVSRTQQLPTESIVAFESAMECNDSMKRKHADGKLESNEDEFSKRPKLDGDSELPSNGYMGSEDASGSCNMVVESLSDHHKLTSENVETDRDRRKANKIKFTRFFDERVNATVELLEHRAKEQKIVNIDFQSWKKIALSNPIERTKFISFLKLLCKDARSLDYICADLLRAIWPNEDIANLLAEPQLEKQPSTKQSPEKTASNASIVVMKTEFPSKEVKHLPTTSTSLSSTQILTVSSEATHSKVVSPQKVPRISSSLDDSAIGGTREQLVQRAKQEAYVMQRVKELRKSGTWSQKKLPKIVEPVRCKTHWDYLLEEMQWLANDFAQERRWKFNSAKKCAKIVLKYHIYKTSQKDREEKEQQIMMKKLASNIAKMIKHFWSDVEKMVETKKEFRLNEKRKTIHDMHLTLIVNKADHLTEKLTQELASNSQTLSVKLESDIVRSDPEQDNEEFERGSICSDDDEETIAKQEAQEAKESVDYSDELNHLNAESEMPLDKLLSNYGFDNVYGPDDASTADETDMDSDSEESFKDGEKSVLADLVQTHAEDGKDITEIVEEVAMSIQPKGNTLSAVQVSTKVPFLLKYPLREYQHVGLNWLAAAYEHNLNGILADEMGLGKTIQTIALIAHLACEKGIWGPHLIVVPTSVMLNWEMEFKKWCPALKILTYYGSTKERKLKRKGWTKPNNFHVCITSYKLVIQDHSSFRRKKWHYMVLDEAQHIKNFKSQRWQMLLKFNTVRRLLLTGTPLQNTLLELWSLLHFLMPHVFESSLEFKDWFANPLACMIEGQQDYDASIFDKLHKVLRPFILRRLKCEVEKQLPKKYEHVIRCHLSKRQRFLYDEYMSLSKTKETLESGNFLSVINILMQLRKVCNHPNLFDPRPTVSPFTDTAIELSIPGLIYTVLDYQPMKHVNPSLFKVALPFHLESLVNTILLCYNELQMERICNTSDNQIYLRLSDYKDFHRFIHCQRMNTDYIAIKRDPFSKDLNNKISDNSSYLTTNSIRARRVASLQKDRLHLENSLLRENTTLQSFGNETKSNELEIAHFKEDRNETVVCENAFGFGRFAREKSISKVKRVFKEKLTRLSTVNQYRGLSSGFSSSHSDGTKLFGLFDRSLVKPSSQFSTGGYCSSVFSLGNGRTYCKAAQADKLSDQGKCDFMDFSSILSHIVHTPETLEQSLQETLTRFLCVVPSVFVSPAKLSVSHLPSYKKIEVEDLKNKCESIVPAKSFQIFNIPQTNLRLQFPELRLIQYDCGKLQILDKLLCQLKIERHRVLIFTQMSRMLDIFEQFLNYHGHTYLRLDGTTKIDQRQALMERFNADSRIFCFILSTRSGGVGVNLTGADTVIFYDSDWNPSMDAQAQDRCHRIGQTRDVHIYRLISERTIEENILRKANQKKLLGDMTIDEGNFNTAYFKQSTIKELFDVDASSTVPIESFVSTESDNSKNNLTNSAFEQALCDVEEKNDVDAAKNARAEVAKELDEFNENIPIEDVPEEKSPEEERYDELISQLSYVELYALKYIENSTDFKDLKEFDEQIENTKQNVKRDFEEWKKQQENGNYEIQLHHSIMTVSREDASQTKVFMSSNSVEPMPIWTPPTPPQGENDLYIDYSIGIMYDHTAIMSESQLPPIYVPKDNKRARIEPAPISVRNKMVNAPTAFTQSSNKPSRRTDDYYSIPKSPFDRSTSMISRFRRELLLMKIKLWPGNHNLVSAIHRALANVGTSSIPPSNLPTQQNLCKSQSTNPNCFLPKLAIHEEFAIVTGLMYLQDLPFNLSIICPGHTPNWEFVAEQVNTFNCVKRSAKQCKYHFESILIGADEQLEESTIHSNITCIKQSKSSKKSKNQNVAPQSNFLPGMNNQSPLAGGPNTSLATSMVTTLKGQNTNMLNSNSPTQPLLRLSNIIQKMQNDNYMNYTREMNERFAAIKQIVIQKTQTSKSRFNKQSSKAHDFAKLLAEHKIRYDQPLSVEETALRRNINMNSRSPRANQARLDSELARQHALYQRTNSSVASTSVSHQQLIVRANPLDHQTQQQPQQTQMLVNPTSSSTSAQLFSASQVQQALNTNKIASVKIASNLTSMQGNDGSNSTVADPSNLPTKFQINTSHIVNLQSTSPNVHQVTLPQTLSLVNQSVTPLQQQQSQHQELSSSLQQHLQQHSSSSAVSGQTGQYVLQSSQPISTAVSLPTSGQKVFCVTCTASTTNVSVSGLTQSAQITIPANQAISSGQVTRLQYPANHIRNLNLLKQQQLRQLQAQQQQLQQQQSSGVQMTSQSRQLQVPSVRAQNMATLQASTQRYQITSIGSPAALVTQSMITSGPIKQVIATTGMTSATTTTSMSAMVSSPRILSSTSAQQIGGSIKALNISTSGASQQTTSIPVSYIKTSSSSPNVSSIQIHATNASSSLLSNSSTFTIPITPQLAGNKNVAQSPGCNATPSTNSLPGTSAFRYTVMAARRAPSTIPVSSTVSGSAVSAQVLTHKSLVQQGTTGTAGSLVTSGEHQQHPSSRSSPNIISPMLHPSSSATISNKTNTFHIVPSNLQQPLGKGVLSSSSTVTVHQGVKQGSHIIMQSSTSGSHLAGQLTSNPSALSTATNTSSSSPANIILTPQQMSSPVKSGASQHFIAVSSGDTSSSGISVNANTIKLLSTSAGAIALQHGQQVSSPSATGLSHSISTPKGHIIISGHPASIAGSVVASGSSAITANTSTPSTLLQQPSNQASPSGQTLTFAIRAPTGQSAGSQLVTLKNPANVTGLNQSVCSANISTHQTPALVAALAQTSSSGDLPTSAGSTLLRTLTSTGSTKVVLMQPSQNTNLANNQQVSLISLSNAGSMLTTSRSTSSSNKITTATQTSGSGLILSAAAKVVPEGQHFTIPVSKPTESPLIEALKSPTKAMICKPSDLDQNEPK